MITNKLTLTAKKSNLLLNNPKLNSSPTVMNLICYAGSINSVNKAKYLGIYLDYKLNFLDHIKMVEMRNFIKVEICFNEKCPSATLPFFSAFIFYLWAY